MLLISLRVFLLWEISSIIGKMKVNINVEIDTENQTDVNTIEELIDLIRKIKEQKDQES